MSSLKELACDTGCGRKVRVDRAAVTARCGICMMKPRWIAKPSPNTVLPDKSPLRGFVRAECANFDRSDYACLMRKAGPCAVLQGARCEYFEGAVLPAALQKAEYKGVPDAYADLICGPIGKLVSNRRCAECGTRVKGRRKYCKECASKRTRSNRRIWKRRKAAG
ncbi:MAG TPA: cysteine-rich VLP protein [Phycisphaerae bacterium]|nr:cysteine-rich VLP protein [Phycisphaerae bacterium]